MVSQRNLIQVKCVIGQLNIEGKTKVETAIERIKYYGREVYYVAISGGKDSDVLVKLFQLSEVEFELHHQHTTIDAPQTVTYIKEHYPTTIIDYPKKSIWQLIADQGVPPTRLMRYCCKELKEYGGEGRFKALGVRWSESSKRKNNRKMIEFCYKKDTRTLNPIVDWSDSEIWEFHKQYNLPHNPLYDLGAKRVGCIGCPQKGRKGMEADFKMFPKYRDNYIRAFTKMLATRDRKGLKTTWKTSEDVMEWWLKISE